MSGKNTNIKFIMGVNRDMLKKMLDDISDEESLKTASGLINHIKWQTAHLAFYQDWSLGILGGEKILKDAWVDMSKGGDQKIDNSAYPRFESLRTVFFDLYDKLEQRVGECDDAFLDEEVELFPGYKATRMNGIMFVLVHENYHSGQIAMIRKSLGRNRANG